MSKPKTVRVRVSFELESDDPLMLKAGEWKQVLPWPWLIKHLSVERVPKKRRKSR